MLKECENKREIHKINRSEREDLIQLEEIIRANDEVIKQLNVEIDSLKKNDKNIIEEDSPVKATDSSDKEPLFKLAEEMKHSR